jgi:hypothetical protein
VPFGVELVVPGEVIFLQVKAAANALFASVPAIRAPVLFMKSRLRMTEKAGSANRELPLSPS